MRVIFLDANSASATGETTRRSYALARRLIDRGHQVTMLTSDREVEVPSPARRRFHTTLEGIPTVVANVGLGRRRSRRGRIWPHLRFAAAASWQLLRGDRPDVILAVTPSVSTILPALLTKWLRGVPFVLDVREVWPEVPFGLDLFRSRILFVLLRALSMLGYRSARSVIALTEPAAHHIEADIPLARKVVRIGSCCDLDLFARADGSAIRAAQGWTHKFVCLHVGPMIRATGLEAILRVADVLREDEQFVFWLVGDGLQREELERNIRDRELHNVIVWDDVPRSRLPEVIGAADVGLLTVRRSRILEQASSHRLLDYLAAGKPVLLNYSGWQRELLEAHRAGMGTPLGDSAAFFEHICRLCDQPELRAEMGRNARKVAEAAGDPDAAADQLERVLAAAGQPDPDAEVRMTK